MALFGKNKNEPQFTLEEQLKEEVARLKEIIKFQQEHSYINEEMLTALYPPTEEAGGILKFVPIVNLLFLIITIILIWRK